MNKPGKSQKLLITGLVLQGMGGVAYVNGIVSSIQSSLLDDTTGSNAGLIVGGLLSFIGWLLLLAGVSRASAGIDYLISREPVPAALAHEVQATPTLPEAPSRPPANG